MSVVSFVVDAVLAAVDGAGWLGLAAAMAVETVFPPIPSELVLPLAGSQLAGGTLSFFVAVLAATAGSVLGAWALYALGRLRGRRALLRLGPLLHVDEARLARMDSWFARRGDWLVFLGRLVPGVRAVVSVPAGTARMPLWRFLVLTAIGSMVWNAGLIEIGQLLAARWTEVPAAAAAARSGRQPDVHTRGRPPGRVARR